MSHYCLITLTVWGTIHDMSAVSYIETAHTICEVLDDNSIAGNNTPPPKDAKLACHLDPFCCEIELLHSSIYKCNVTM